MPGTESLAVGTVAPDFELDGTGGTRFRLSVALRAGPVALFFYPANDTPG